MELWDIRDGDSMVTGDYIVRGEVLEPGTYHLVVCVILRTPDHQYLISRRAEGRPGAGLWEVVGGSVTAGEDSLEGAIREVAEEVGLVIEPDSIELLSHSVYDYPRSFILDVYRYEGPIDMSRVVPQVEEVAEVALVDEAHIFELMTKGLFFSSNYVAEDYFTSRK
jgi:8-oxo-dGTP pyrophosphatase MutT (NUDIX family)